jgi:Zn finger protein HypA/HybF involved in hydrogenase expression
MEAPAAEKVTFPCHACGANLEFSPGQGELVCQYCGTNQNVEKAEAKPIVEYSFEEARRSAKTISAKALVRDAVEVRCDGCGAHTMIAGKASRCAFCDSPVVLVDSSDEVFVPESLLPFKIDDKKAVEQFRQWVKSRWFAPSDLASRASKEAMDGVFIPYWTYDSRTTTSYTGQRGTYYYESQSYRDAQGKTRTRQVRKTRWSFTAGTVYVNFDDVLVPATKSLPQPMMNELEPWDLNNLSPYDPAYLAGFQAEKYGIDLEQGFVIAQGRMEARIRSAIKSDIGGDDQRILGMRTRHANVTFKHLLLPIWIAAYRYHEKIFRFLVNGRTGEVQGERPYSAIKIAAFSIGCLLLAIALYMLFKDSGG